MTMGKAIVTNQSGAVPLSHKGKEAIMIGKIKYEIAGQVIKLLNNKELRKQFGIKARNVILKEYTWEIIGKRYENLYKEILKNSF